VCQQRRDRLEQQVAEAFAFRKGRSGFPGLTLDLTDQGHHYDPKSVAASMKRQGLRAKAAKKNQSHHQFEPQSASGTQFVAAGLCRH